jgi:NADH-quinone oxidoreductase subunit N
MTTLPLELTALAPLWFVVTGAVALLLLEMFLNEKSRVALPLVAMTFLVLALGADFNLLSHPGMLGALFNRSVVVDLYSVTLQMICLLSALLTVVFSSAYLKREKAVTGEYYALILLAAAGMVVLVSASEFLTLFVGLELMSIAGYVLAGYLRVKERSTEAALKYFLNGVFSSAFLLYGIAILFGISGTTHFSDLRLFLEKDALVSTGGFNSTLFIQLGAALLLVGLGFKVALVPFHGWAPDVYDGAPAPVSAFLATGVKAAAFGVFARLFTEVFGLPGSWTTAICVLAVFTMILGNLGALAQSNLKRLLAYSSVAHAGYLAVGLAAAAGSPADSVERAVVFYLLAYTFMTAGAFGWVAWASGAGENQTDFEDYRGLGYRHPWMGIALGIFMFSLAGMTPTAGFFGKFYLFKLAADNGLLWLVVIAVLNSFVSAYYYLRVVMILYSKPAAGPRSVVSPVSIGLFFAFFLCALGALAAGFLKFPF